MTQATRLDDALKRANQYTREAIEKPDDASLYNGLAELVIAWVHVKEAGDG